MCFIGLNIHAIQNKNVVVSMSDPNNKLDLEGASKGLCCSSICSSISCPVKCAMKLVCVVLLSFVVSYFTAKHYSGNGNNSEKIIGQWVNNNAEAIIQSVNIYANQQRDVALKQQQQDSSKQIIENKVAIEDTTYSGVVNPNGKITVVEFYDYRCGYCKKASYDVSKIAKENKDVRVIYKDLPILGEESMKIARASIAVSMIDKEKGKDGIAYKKFHKFMMEDSSNSKYNGNIDKAIKDAVNSTGLSLKDFKNIMTKKSSEIDNAIKSNLSLASNLNITGTPVFIINGEMVRGAVGYDTMKSLIKK